MWTSRREIVYCSVFTWKHCCHFNQWLMKTCVSQVLSWRLGEILWATAALAPTAPWLPRPWCQ